MAAQLYYSVLVDPDDLFGPWLQQFVLQLLSRSGRTYIRAKPQLLSLTLFSHSGSILVPCLTPLFKSSRATYMGNIWTNIASALVGGLQVLKGCSGHSNQSAAHSQRTDFSTRSDEYQGTALLPKSPNDYLLQMRIKQSGGEMRGLLDIYDFEQGRESTLRSKKKDEIDQYKKKVSSVKLGRNKDEGTLSEEHNEELNLGDTQEDFLLDRPGFEHSGPIQSQSQPQQPSQATDPKDKGKGILLLSKTLIPMDSEKKREMLKASREEAKRLLGNGKLQFVKNSHQ
ncbi:hypothetical protein Tco_0190420 [Tanacetum coccineum]